MESTILALALSVIRSVIKDPKKKARLKFALLQLRDAINAAYGE